MRWAHRPYRYGVLALVLGFAVGCSGSEEPMSVVFTTPQEHGTIPFTATGEAVDAEAVCPAGSQTTERLENLDGVEIDDEIWSEMFDAALEIGGIAEMNIRQTWDCDDGSGSFDITFHNRIDFATFEFEGRHDVGTWEITGGGNSFEDLTGTGSVTLDWDAAQVEFPGEITGS